MAINERGIEMMNSRTKIIFLTLALSIAMTGAAVAQGVLWDQTAGYEGWSIGYYNVIAGGPPMGMTMYTANDIVVPSSGWTIESIKVYYDGFNPSWAGSVTSAVLYLEPKTGSMPVGDPSTGTAVTVTTTLLGNGFIEVAATGLAMDVYEGEYWISLTPNTPNADNIHVSVAAVGDFSPTYDPFGFPMPGWMVWNADLDGAMLIEGWDPVPTEEVSLGSVKALYR